MSYKFNPFTGTFDYIDQTIPDNDTTKPASKSDGYIGSAYISAEGRIYFWVNDTRYYVTGTIDAEVAESFDFADGSGFDFADGAGFDFNDTS